MHHPKVFRDYNGSSLIRSIERAHFVHTQIRISFINHGARCLPFFSNTDTFTFQKENQFFSSSPKYYPITIVIIEIGDGFSKKPPN